MGRYAPHAPNDRLKDREAGFLGMEYSAFIHLYFNEEDVQKFKDGGIDTLWGYTKTVKSVEDTVHLSIPLGKVRRYGYGCYELLRTDFGGEF